jgi:hypothetical protein
MGHPGRAAMRRVRRGAIAFWNLEERWIGLHAADVRDRHDGFLVLRGPDGFIADYDPEVRLPELFSALVSPWRM